MNFNGDHAGSAVAKLTFETQLNGALITCPGLAVALYDLAAPTVTITAAITLSADVNGVVGSHLVSVDTSNVAYSTGKNYALRATTGTVNGVSIVGMELATFSIQNRYMRGTDSAALSATALSTAQWSNTRAGYLDNLSAGAAALQSSLAALIATVGVSAVGVATAVWAFATRILTAGTNVSPVTIAADGIAEAAFAADTAKYQGKIVLVDDDGGTADRYVVVWFKNGQPVLSGITVPTIQVVKVADGTDLVSSTAMTQIGSTSAYRYTEAVNRIVSGVAYMAVATATIDASTRSWRQPIGRDSAV